MVRETILYLSIVFSDKNKSTYVPVYFTERVGFRENTHKTKNGRSLSRDLTSLEDSELNV